MHSSPKKKTIDKKKNEVSFDTSATTDPPSSPDRQTKKDSSQSLTKQSTMASKKKHLKPQKTIILEEDEYGSDVESHDLSNISRKSIKDGKAQGPLKNMETIQMSLGEPSSMGVCSPTP